MFVGSLPKVLLSDLIRAAGVAEWPRVFVCCSGTFRIEAALTSLGVEAHGNDVSLYTCALAGAIRGEVLPLQWIGELEWLQPFVGDTIATAATVVVANEVAQFSGKTAYAEAHRRYYRDEAAHVVARAREHLVAWLPGVRMADFFAGDFREHARNAAAAGAGVLAYPPTYKGGYERLFRYLDANAQWDRPEYSAFDPKSLPSWLDELDGMQVPFAVCADQDVEGRQPVGKHLTQRGKPVFIYASGGRSFLRVGHGRSQAFKFTAVDAAAIHKRSVVEVATMTAQHMNFLKDRFLAKGIAHSPGRMNFAVFIDGKLAGGFIYADEKYGGGGIYLLSDFSTVRANKVSKLIAMLATCEQFVHEYERVKLTRVERITTTAFTDKPVSMKYRGVFELVSRKPGRLQYESEVRRIKPQGIFNEWWRRYASGN